MEMSQAAEVGETKDESELKNGPLKSTYMGNGMSENNGKTEGNDQCSNGSKAIDGLESKSNRNSSEQIQVMTEKRFNGVESVQEIKLIGDSEMDGEANEDRIVCKEIKTHSDLDNEPLKFSMSLKDDDHTGNDLIMKPDNRLPLTTENEVNDSSFEENKQKAGIPTPVFEDISEDDDSDTELDGANIELELDDPLDSTELSKSDDGLDAMCADQCDEFEGKLDDETCVNDVDMQQNESVPSNEIGKSNFTTIRSSDPPSDGNVHKRHLKLTARKSGKPVSQSDNAPLKTINLHPIKDITMNLSEVEGALYLPMSKKSPVKESQETSSTENSLVPGEARLFLGAKKKRRKRSSYDLPGCKRRMKKIRSDAESLGSSTDSLNIADHASLSDGDYQEGDSHVDALSISKDDTDSIKDSPVHGMKVMSALDILTKNSHLSFIAKKTKHSSMSSSSNTLSSKKSPNLQSKASSSAKNQGKITSVLDMLHRRSQQKVDSAGNDIPSPITNDRSTSKISDNADSECTSGTTTTTISVTSAGSSTTTTIMVTPNKPVIEGMKRKGTPRKRKGDGVVCLSDSDGESSNEAETETTYKKDSPEMTMLTLPVSSNMLNKSRASSRPNPSANPNAPVVMVVAQHPTTTGMRSLLPQQTVQTSRGVGIQPGGKIRAQTPLTSVAGSPNLLPAISTLPFGPKPIALFGPITAPISAGGTIPNLVNIGKQLIYAPPSSKVNETGQVSTNANAAIPQLATSPLTNNTSPLSSAKADLAANPSISNLESLRALLVGKPVALNSLTKASSLLSSSSTTLSSLSPSAAASLLSTTPMLFQMASSSGNTLVPISAQPLNIKPSSQAQIKQFSQQSLLKTSTSSLLPSFTSNKSSEIKKSNGVFNKPNVLNGVACLTPPKTPEGDSSLEVAAAATLSRLVSSQSETSEVIPLCCCKINGSSFDKLTAGATYCQALDTFDNKVIGCFNKVSNSVLVRPGVKIPFMAVCESHRKRLKLHQCCPGCGHFCTQGKFQQCRLEGKDSSHTFHKQCMFYRGGKYLCPHCGEECNQGSVEMKLEAGPEGTVVEIGVSSASKRDAPARKTARMGGRNIKKKSPEKVPIPEEKITLPNKKVIEIADIPFGPDQHTLKKLSKCATEDRPKKYRNIGKDLYTPALEGDLEKVFYLLVDGMDVNARYDEQDGQTPLHAAATSGSIGTVMLLEKFGAELHSQDMNLRTPITCAAENGNLEIVKFLHKAGAKLEDRGEDGMTSLHYAAKAGHLNVIKYILSTERLDVNIEDDGGWTPIIWATESQLLDIVKFLVKHGGDPNKKDHEENTGLHWAAFSGSLCISEVFLDMGCELDSPNEHGDRPLHIAARQDHYDIVVLLLARGANVDLKNNKDETPVESCVNKAGQTWMALKVNQQLRSFASRKFIYPERLLERDITIGREKNPIACVNAEDDEPCPTDYLYVTQNVETSWLNVNCIITSLQSCRCKDDCSSMYCVCGRSSIKCWYDKMGRLLEEVNLLEPPLVFECNRACRCLISCNNRVVQNGIQCRLQMFRTNGRGWGVRTLMDIPKGTFVCEYIGELISDSEADIRKDDSYLFDLDNKDGDTYCIDARKYGNISRFINHLCEPNLVPVKVFVEHQDLRFPRICLFSSKDIGAYEELGFDYGEKFWMIKWKFFTCACKSSKCKYSSDTIQKTLEDYKLRYPDEDVD